MIRYLLTAFSAAVLISVTTLPAVAGWVPSERCNQLLTNRAVGAITVPIKFFSRYQAANTYEESLSALRNLSRDPKKLQYTNEVLAPLVKKASEDLFTKLGSTFYKTRELLDIYYRVGALLGPQKPELTNPEDTYEGPMVAEIYQEFGSPLQYYFSLMMAGYYALRTDVSPEQQLKVVELGVAVGDTTKALNQIFKKPIITAVDRSVCMQKVYRNRYPKNKFLQHDFNKSNFDIRSNSQDLVISLSAASLYAGPDSYRKLAKDVHRFLKPGGHFLVDIGPNHLSLRQGQNLDQFLQEMSDIGFEAETMAGLLLQREDRIYCPVLLRKKPI